jgi:simple sugar transport system substrate-binding protein
MAIKTWAVILIAIITFAAGGGVGYFVKPGPEIPHKHFEGIKIHILLGGPTGDPFATIQYNGARAAQQDLGCDVVYKFGDWSPETLLRQFKESIAEGPDGIATHGYPGPESMGPLIDEAFQKGIIVTTFCNDLPPIEQKYKDKGMGYAGSVMYTAGWTLAKAAVERCGLKPGDRAMVYGLLWYGPIRSQRTKACIDALNDSGLIVDYVEISPEVNADPSLGIPVVTSYIASHPDVKLIITDHGAITAAIPTYFKTAGIKPGQIYGAGFDMSAPIIDGIREGYITVVLDQQPYLQGYLAILQICMAKKYGFTGLHIDTGAGLVDKTNVEFVAKLVEQQIR